MLRVPLSTAEAMKSVLDDLGGRISKAKHADPTSSSTTAWFGECSRAASSTPSKNSRASQNRR